MSLLTALIESVNDYNWDIYSITCIENGKSSQIKLGIEL